MQVFSQNILRETVLPDDFAEKHGAWFRPSFKGREIDINQTEVRLETSPFIIIHERLVEITVQINTPGAIHRELRRDKAPDKQSRTGRHCNCIRFP